MAEVIAIANQKGGVGKTMTSVSLSACLALHDKKVLLVDLDPQGHSTKAFGYYDSSQYPLSMRDVILSVIQDIPIDKEQLILHSDENVDIVPSNISLASIGFDELFNGEFYNKIASIKNNNPNPLYIRNSLMNAGCEKQLEILDFLNTLDYENSKNSDVLLTDELDTVNAFFNDSNKINNFLTNYKNTSINNYDSYMYLAALNTIVNGKNLEWPVLSEEQQKILIKKLNSDSRAA